MQAISFLAGVVTEGVRSVGSAVRPSGGGDTGFNSLLAKAISDARADEGTEGAGGRGVVSQGGDEEGHTGTTGQTTQDGQSHSGQASDGQASASQASAGQASGRHQRSGITEGIDAELPGSETAQGGIAIHGGNGSRPDPIQVPISTEQESISIHGGNHTRPDSIGVPMGPGSDGQIAIHGGAPSEIAPIAVPMGHMPEDVPSEGPDTIDPFDRIRLDRARQPERAPGGFDITGMRSAGSGTGTTPPLFNGTVSSGAAPVSGTDTGSLPDTGRVSGSGSEVGVPADLPNTEADNDGRFTEAGMGVDRASAAESPSDASADPRTPDRDLDRIHPELRTRLERVVERMASEHGHRVEVVEGFRSAERQSWLYAQGRQRPGQVVTWTRNSMHMEGLAADLNIDGGWENPTAFAKLQRIAQEEGLSTLGMRDPGHVELEVSPAMRRADLMAGLQSSSMDAHVSSESDSRAARFSDAQLERPNGFSQVSRVAQVARVADIARIATVAVPGSSGPAVAADASATSAGSIAAPNANNGGATLAPGIGATTAPGAGTNSAPISTAPASSPALATGAGQATAPASAAGTTPPPVTAPPAPDFSGLTGGFGTLGTAATPAGTTIADGAAGAAARPTPAQAGTGQSAESSTAASAGSAATTGVSTDDSADAGAGEGSPDSGSDQASRQASNVTRNSESGARVGGTAPGAFRPDFAVGSTEAIRGASTIERLEQIMALQDRSAAGTDGWRLTMPDADGMGTRLRMGLRGSMVDAQIDTSDPIAAARMRTRVAELHRALEARGLEGDQFSFRSGGAVEALEAMTGVRSTPQSNADFVRAFMADLTGQSDERNPRRSPNDSPFESNGRGRDSNDQSDQENRR